MTVSREWSVFAGALFTLMGLSLAAGARRSASDALSWERQWRTAVGALEPARDEEPLRGRIMLAYRVGGLFFTSVGLSLLFLVVTGRAAFAVRGGGREALLGGILFTACGAVMAVNTWLRRGRRAPRFLEGELLAEDAPSPLGERVAALCGHAMMVLFFSFGLRLLRDG